MDKEAEATIDGLIARYMEFFNQADSESIEN